jgi:hypothetical protein
MKEINTDWVQAEFEDVKSKLDDTKNMVEIYEKQVMILTERHRTLNWILTECMEDSDD